MALSAQQRGASNLYFPIVESALSIPPWSSRIQELLGHVWESIINCERERRRDFLERLRPDLAHVPYTTEELALFINEFEDALERTHPASLRPEEYAVLNSNVRFEERDHEFELRPGAAAGRLGSVIDRVSRVMRLREVRAIYGFTRLTPPTGDFHRDGVRAAPLAAQRKAWLPATEVRGEGIFVSLQPAALGAWENESAIVNRTKLLDDRFVTQLTQRFGEAELTERLHLTPRFILLHSLAHVLMREVALDCGYSTAALRERIYASTDPSMCGVLIYTASPDADGTLGGLVSQGIPQRMEEIITSGLRAIEWCSNDPLCGEGKASGLDGLSHASCHACLLAPETACEHFNRFLDRGLLVGTAADPELGYFHKVIE